MSTKQYKHLEEWDYLHMVAFLNKFKVVNISCSNFIDTLQLDQFLEIPNKTSQLVP
jgi:hypothetical protein